MKPDNTEGHPNENSPVGGVPKAVATPKPAGDADTDRKGSFRKNKKYDTQFGEVEVVGPAPDEQEGFVCPHCDYHGVPNLVRAVVEPPTSIACPDCGKTEHER